MIRTLYVGSQDYDVWEDELTPGGQTHGLMLQDCGMCGPVNCELCCYDCGIRWIYSSHMTANNNEVVK